MAVWSEVRLSGLYDALRLDAEFYQPKYLESAKQLEHHTVQKLGCLSAKIDVGHVGSMTSHYATIGVPLLQTRNVRPFFLEMNDCVKITPAFHRTLRKSQVRSGDILLARSGSFGAAAMYFGDDTINSADIIIIEPRSGAIEPLYLLAFMNSWYGQFQLRRFVSGGVQGHINLTILEKLEVPLLSQSEQQRVVRIVTRARERANQSETLFAEAETLLESALDHLDKVDLTPQLFYERTYADVQAAERFDAEYFQPPKEAVLDALAKEPGQAVGDQCHSVHQLWQPDQASATDQVRNYDLTHALKPFLDETVEPATRDSIASTKKKLNPGDLVVSRLRSYLKEIAVVLDTGPTPMVGSTEFIVLRPQKGAVRVEALLVYLRSRYVQTVLEWCQDGSNHPRFDEEELLRVRVPAVVRDIEDEVSAKVQASIQARRDARRLLEEARTFVEQAIVREA